ncbi:MAG: phosphate ABC transporter substrate-binding protein [Acidobacteriota bacterium]|jgi:phosphate transport system substrate-binding protein
MKPVCRLALIVGLAVVLGPQMGCGGDRQASDQAAARADVSISWSGCGITKKAFVERLAAAYEESTGIRVNVSGGGATKGVRGADAGTIDVGGSCRHRLDGPEEDAAFGTIVAWDALVAIVNPENRVSNLTGDQLRNILLGEITDWSEVSGASAPITVLARNGKISGVGRMVRELIFQDPATDFTSSALIYSSSTPLEQEVETVQGVIGMTGVSSARKRNVKILSLNGVLPDYENIASGAYPHVRPLYLFTQGPPTGDAKGFVDFALSPEGQALIKAEGTVNLEDGRGLFAAYAERMRQLGIAEETWNPTA